MTYTREDIEQCKPSERPLVRAMVAVRVDGMIVQVHSVGSIIVERNNPTICVEYRGAWRYLTIGWSLLLSVLNDPTESPVSVDPWGEYPITMGR